MQKTLILSTLSLLIGLQGSPADAFRSCREVFSKRPIIEHLFGLQREHAELENISHPQEAVWALEAAGKRAEANDLLAKIEGELRGLESHRFEPEKWQPLSSEGNIHKVYRVHLNGISAVVKTGERPALIEPLVYQIAKLLKVPVPLTIELSIDGHPVMVQVYLHGWKTADIALRNGEVFETNKLIEFFDHLIANWDRSSGNIMVPISGGPRSIKQIAIDNEFAFDINDPAAILQTGANPFLLQNLRSIRAEFPGAHQAFLDPSIQNRVSGLVESSGLMGASRFSEHMRQSLRAYENVNRLFAD